MIAASAATSAFAIPLNLDLWVQPQENVEQSRLHPYPLHLVWWLFTEQITEASILVTDPYERVYEYILAQKSTDITSQIEEVLIWLLQNRIIIPRPDEVRDYLLRHSDMTALLPAIYHRAGERFGTQTQLSLEVYRDPEVEDEYLTLYIRQERYDEHILGMIDSICAECEAELASSSGWLIVTTDFRPPR